MVLGEWFQGTKEVGVRFQMKEMPPRPGDTSGVPVFCGEEFNLDNLKGAFEVTVAFEENGSERFIFNVLEVRTEHDSDRVSLHYALAQVGLVLVLVVGRRNRSNFTEKFHAHAA